jgi:hypothetical protein
MAMKIEELEERVKRLTAQSAALISVLKVTAALDGRPILYDERWSLFQDNLTKELRAVGLE